MLRTIKKLNKKGFSVVEIVIAVVVVVAVAGLGLYSFNNRTKTTSTSSTPASTESGAVSDADEASAAAWSTLKAPVGRSVAAKVCRRGAGKFDVLFYRTGGKFYGNKSPNTPSVGNYSKSTGGASNARFNGTKLWWNGDLQLHKNVFIGGNDNSYLSVAYNSKAGARVKRANINACR